jgi:hypothetical protein
MSIADEEFLTLAEIAAILKLNQQSATRGRTFERIAPIGGLLMV